MAIKPQAFQHPQPQTAPSYPELTPKGCECLDPAVFSQKEGPSKEEQGWVPFDFPEEQEKKEEGKEKEEKRR